MMLAGGSAGVSAAEWFAEPDEIAAWADAASAGETFTYARAAALPIESAAAVAARRLFGAGMAALHTRREGGRLTYILRRVKQRIAARAEPVSRKIRGEDARVYRLLYDAAHAGAACPTNSELMRAARLKSPQQASYLIHRLIVLGKIERRMPSARRRIVTIIATGQSTAEGVS